MSDLSFLKQQLPKIQESLGYFFKDTELLVLAFIHRSFVNENKENISEHNERLEFLGDSVLNLVMARHLYLKYPDKTEGELSSLRAHLVDSISCERYMSKLDLEAFLLMGKGEKINLGKARKSLLANLFEALLGAMYLDGGLEPVRDFLLKRFDQEIASFLHSPLKNFKARLQDLVQKKYQQTPQYVVVEESGPDHQKAFEVKVEVKGVEQGRGKGHSKKEAQQKAAQEALSKLQQKD